MFDKTMMKRVKRHVTGRSHPLFAATAPGLETLCFQELSTILKSGTDMNRVPGGMEFKGRLIDVYRANLDLRTPLRITLRVACFRASNFRQFEKHIARVPWELHIKPDTALHVHVKTIHSRLYHTAAICDRLRQGVADIYSGSLTPPDPNVGNPVVQNLFARAVDDRFTVSLDSTGDLLYKRGLKTGGGRAPIRETLAAAALAWAGYTGQEPLIDPMCGSGTFSLEAAMIANGIPPGWHREFTFMNWPAFREEQWFHLKKERTGKIVRPTKPRVFAFDIEPSVCATLKSVAHRFDLSATIKVENKDFFRITPAQISRKKGVVTLNPPYGIRLGSVKKSHRLYTEIASKLKNDYKGWRVAIFLSDRRLLGKFPAVLKRRTVQHGGLELTLLTGKI